MPFSRLKARLLAWFVFWMGLLAVVAGLMLVRLQSLAATLDSVFHDRLVCQVLLRDVGDAYRVRVATAVERFASARADAPSSFAAVTAAQQQAALDWQRFKGSFLVEAEQRAITQIEPMLARADASIVQLLQQVQAGDTAGALRWWRDEMPTSFSPLGEAIDSLFRLQVVVAEQDLQHAREKQRNTVITTVVLTSVGLVLGLAGTWAMVVHYTGAARASADALRRMNAFYTALSRTNHLIVRGSGEAELLRELSLICTESGRARVAAVFVLDGELATRFAVAGAAADFFGDQPPLWNVTAPEYRLSVTAAALSTGVRRIGRVALSEGQAGPAQQWRASALRHGIQSIAAFPLLRGGRVYGALSVYASEPDFFDEPLVKLLAEMAADVSFALDSLDREAARARLQAQTEQDLARFQTLFLALPVACVITTLADRRLLEVNDVMCAHFGLRREDVVGRSIDQIGGLLVDDDLRHYRELLARDGRVHNLEARMQWQGQHKGQALVNAEVISYNGQACVLAMALDVTELRATQAAAQAQATAEAANREKTAFLSRMSHELRTPLNAMLGFTQLLQRDAGTRLLPPHVEQLEHIRQAGWHLLSLVNDVMDVSRIEAGQFKVSLTSVPLAAALDEALRLAEQAAHGAAIHMLAAYRSVAPVAVLADPVRLRQVLINLLSNAVKYNRPGGTVRVSVQMPNAPDDAPVVVEISDTGLGMSPEQLAHLYEPFNRLGRERGGIEGTGLGLALTRQLLGLMGGELQVSSEAGLGTTVRVQLRAATVGTGALASPAAQAVAADSAVALQAPQGTVLYIEDNDINVMVIEEMLSRWPGVRFLHAPTAQSGLEQAAWQRPGLVLMDMHLPDMDGFELLQRLQQLQADSGTAPLCVVVLSGSAMSADVTRALAGGAADYWTKPVDLDQFLHGVSRHLRAGAVTQAEEGHGL